MTDHALNPTIRYLRFPLAADHRAPVQDGSCCPHCKARHVQKWGRFSGRQRYRCCSCERTFSTFTSTALYYLKRPERWGGFLWCVDGRLTVRSSAAVLGLNKNTVLRWRHRLLDQWRQEPRARLKGQLEIGEFCLPRSAKGSRQLSRPPRRRGEGWAPFPFLQTDPMTVLVAWERPGVMIIESLTTARLTSQDYERRIRKRVGEVTAIVGGRGPASPLGRFAVRLDVPYREERVGIWPPRVFEIRRELRAWLRPFRGVASHRLDNYLEWFRRRGTDRGRQALLPPQRSAPTIPTVSADRAGMMGRSGDGSVSAAVEIRHLPP